MVMRKTLLFDLYHPNLRSILDATNEWIHDGINNGVYKCGLATNQEAYDEQLFDAFEKCEEILGKQQFLCGNILTEPYIGLFVTLIRFHEAYAVIFKCDKRLLREYNTSLFNYMKDIFQIVGLITHELSFYKPSWDYIALGLNIDYSLPHDRDRFSTETA
ncbi:hypothetical protein EUTSA_v10001139mg [Eutrema salsugineum]|uniref:Uncharacterized protein n=1 Tax=Eutrema salsugineum TaxID=72664 RepID=V4KNY8_EUTSA|nr:hypothetical protein EUTSA_v10001139mg [Eutrema salsugineum]